MTGLEPANGGTTTHCLNHLATLAKLFLFKSILSYIIERPEVLNKIFDVKEFIMEKTKTFFLNGEEYIIDHNTNLLNIIQYFNYDQSLFVVEYNKFICPKKNWSTVFLENSDIIEIITIVGGG